MTRRQIYIDPLIVSSILRNFVISKPFSVRCQYAMGRAQCSVAGHCRSRKGDFRIGGLVAGAVDDQSIHYSRVERDHTPSDMLSRGWLTIFRSMRGQLSRFLRAGGVIYARQMDRVSIHWPLGLLDRCSAAPITGDNRACEWKDGLTMRRRSGRCLPSPARRCSAWYWHKGLGKRFLTSFPILTLVI
jgi:hypothetical protein